MKDSPPILLIAAIFVVVGIAAAVPAALYLEPNRDARVGDAGEAGVTAVAQARPTALVQAEPVPTVPVTPVAPAITAAAPIVTASAAPIASAKPAEPDGPGFLTISTTPHARVSERGRVLCTSTPCARLPLPPGLRTITLENKEESLKTVISVTITSGEVTSRRVTLKQ